MNKDVIYVEPEDDITDIILKIENSKEKIVALVPPKKAGVFRSVVNIKLIAKSGVTAGKKIVLVTVDPSIIRLAAAARIPVTKNLQTAPAIPEIESEPEVVKRETLVEESDGIVETEEDVEELEGGDKDKDKDDEKDEAGDSDEKSDDGEDEKDEEEDKVKPAKAAKKDKPAKEGKGGSNWFKNHKKTVIFGGICGVLLIGFLVWAFVIAPAANVVVGIKATTNSFSENVTFTSNMADEKASEGKFYLQETKIESVQEVEFEATGKRNKGDKASGKVIVYAYFPLNVKSSVKISEGEAFTISGLTYKATKDVTLSYDGEGKTECANKDNSQGLVDYGCRVNGVVAVVAGEAGSKYNIAASSTGWDTNARVFAYSEEAMTGGTDKEVTVVLQSDIDKAKASLSATNEEENKEKLLAKVGDDALVINASFTQSTGEAVSTPGVGEEAENGKAKLKAVTTASVYSIDETKVSEFIVEKANIAESQKIYDMKDPFIENFSKTADGYVGKLKTTYLTGPNLTVSSILDLVKGKGVGDAQHALKDIDGVTDVKITTSFPWVMAIPDDTNKITVDLEAKDQDGNKVEQPKDDSSNKNAKKSDKEDTAQKTEEKN